MSVVGVGKAFRDQDRATRQARERREGYERNKGSSDLAEVAGEDPCVACGELLPRSELLFSDPGTLCPTCFGLYESEVAGARLPGLWGLTGRRVLRSLPYWGMSALTLLVVAVARQSGLVDGGMVFVVMTWTVALFGITMLLHAIRELAQALRPALGGPRDGWEVASAALGVVVLGLPVGLLSGVALMPLWASLLF